MCDCGHQFWGFLISKMTVSHPGNKYNCGGEKWQKTGGRNVSQFLVVCHHGIMAVLKFSDSLITKWKERGVCSFDVITTIRAVNAKWWLREAKYSNSWDGRNEKKEIADVAWILHWLSLHRGVRDRVKRLLQRRSLPQQVLRGLWRWKERTQQILRNSRSIDWFPLQERSQLGGLFSIITSWSWEELRVELLLLHREKNQLRHLYRMPMDTSFGRRFSHVPPGRDPPDHK